jgi:hypothetical protein
MAVMVICVYQPKSGKEEELQALLGEHHSTLRSLELTTDFVYYARAANGSWLELFEWVSEDHSRSAHDIPAVMEIWGRLSEVCDFKPLASLEEAKSPFSHFTPQAP